MEYGKEFYEKYFNDKRFISTIWDAGNRYKRWLIVGLAGDVKGKRVLDIGCGVGDALFDIAKLGAEAYGIDYSENSIRIAGGYIESGNLKAVLKVGDAQELPFDSGFFDVAICSEVLEHIQDDSKVVREMNRVLKQNGVAIVTVPSGGKPVKEWGHLRHYSGEEAWKLFERNGFRVLEMFYCTRAYTWLWLYPIKGSLYVLNELYSRAFGRRHVYERAFYRKVALPFVEAVIRPIDVYLSKNPSWPLQGIDNRCDITMKVVKIR